MGDREPNLKTLDYSVFSGDLNFRTEIFINSWIDLTCSKFPEAIFNFGGPSNFKHFSVSKNGTKESDFRF